MRLVYANEILSSKRRLSVVLSLNGTGGSIPLPLHVQCPNSTRATWFAKSAACDLWGISGFRRLDINILAIASKRILAPIHQNQPSYIPWKNGVRDVGIRPTTNLTAFSFGWGIAGDLFSASTSAFALLPSPVSKTSSTIDMASGASSVVLVAVVPDDNEDFKRILSHMNERCNFPKSPTTSGASTPFST